MKTGCCRVCVVLALALGFPVAVWANCTKTNALSTANNRSAAIRFDRVNLDNAVMQPAGTLLAATAVPPLNYERSGNVNQNSLLWECDLADVQQGKVYFLLATNGHERLGGHFEMAQQGVPSGTYATWFQYVGLRIKAGDKTITRRWQKVELGDYDTQGNKVRIRLRHIPTLTAELWRLENLPPTSGAPGNACAAMGQPSANGQNYTCAVPDAYIQLLGPGLPHDQDGMDYVNSSQFRAPNNGFGYGLRDAVSLSSRASCVVQGNTPVVTFAPMRVEQLMQQQTTEQNFFVEIKCNGDAASGTASHQTAIGIQTSSAAHHHAVVTIQPPLRNPQGGITHLVADNYDQPTAAKGVGVTLWLNGSRRMFVAQPGWTGGGNSSGNPTGTGAGWYGYKDGATNLSGNASYRTWRYDFTARFGRVNTMTVAPGNFYATATVLVKVQ